MKPDWIAELAQKAWHEAYVAHYDAWNLNKATAGEAHGLAIAIIDAALRKVAEVAS